MKKNWRMCRYAKVYMRNASCSPYCLIYMSTKDSRRYVHEDMNEETKINKIHMNNIRYADDTVLFTKFVQAIQSIFDRVNNTGINYGPSINKKKEKFMLITQETP